MNVFKRIGDIISSNVNSALDKMEDPEKMIDLSIRELEDAIAEMRSTLAEKRIELVKCGNMVKDLKESVERWEERSRMALEKGLDDMAREAIKEKLAAKDRLKGAEEAESTLKEMINSVEESLDKANGKLTSLKETSLSLKARAKLAKARLKVEKQAKTDESASYARRIEEMKAKIERWEALADIHHDSVRTEADKPSFSDLEKDAEVEKELAELKSKMKDENKENV